MSHLKPTQIKYCKLCGEKMERHRFEKDNRLEGSYTFARRQYCSKKCAIAAYYALPNTPLTSLAAHEQARKICPPGPCVKCGEVRQTDVHHKDEDFRNNSLDNLERLCRSCHVRHHRSLDVKLDLRSNELLKVSKRILEACREGGLPASEDLSSLEICINNFETPLEAARVGA